MTIIYLVLVALLVGTGVVVYKVISSFKAQPAPAAEEKLSEELPLVDTLVTVNVTKSRVKDNTIILSISGLSGKYSAVAYELSYDSQGVTQGVTTKPLDVSGKDTFVRDDIYLGTCSRNVCRPHLGVKKVSLVLEFTSTSGKKSQFSKDYDL